MDAHDYGMLRAADTLWRTMAGRDDVLTGVKPKREEAVTRRKPEVVTVNDSSAAMDQKKALEYFWNNATAVNAFDRNFRGGFAKIAEFILEAHSYVYSPLHLVWKPSAKGYTVEFEWLPAAFFENISGELRWLGPQGIGLEGTALDPMNWLVCAGKGLMRPCGIAYGFKTLSWMDWISYNEKFGIPFIKATTNAAKDTEEWDGMVEMVEDFMNDGGGVFSEGSTVDLVTAGNAGSNPFAPLIERCDRAMTALYLGSDLASMSRGGSGNSGASVQVSETVKIEASDCRWLSEQLQRIDKLVLRLTFGEDVEILASTEVRGPVTRDVMRDLQIDAKFIAWGVPVSKADLAERYERSLPDEGEDLVKPPKPEPKSGRAADQQNDDDRETAANERTENRAPGTENIRAAVNRDLQPLRDQVARALQGSDQDLQDWLATLDAMWPEVIDAVLAGDSAEKAIETVLGSAFVDGLDLSQVAANAWDESKHRRGDHGRFVAKSASSIDDVLLHAKEPEKGDWEHEFKVPYTAHVRNLAAKRAGVNLKEARHFLDTQGVRHITKAHTGSEIGEREWQMLPEVIGKADDVTASKTVAGEPAIEFWKMDGSWLLAVETIHKGGALRVHNYKRMKLRPERGAAPPA